MRQELEAIAREAGDLALGCFGDEALQVEAKGPLDLVTRADREVERFIVDRLRRLFPADGILGEEGTAAQSEIGRTWIIDPIDGTFNFVRGGAEWGVSIGLYHDGAPRFGVVRLPVMHETFSGGTDHLALLNGAPVKRRRAFDPSRACVSIGLAAGVPVRDQSAALAFLLEAGVAIRCCGSCVAAMMEVARGETDGYIGLGEHSWDVMAAIPIVEALGARTTIPWNDAALRGTLRFVSGVPSLVESLHPFIFKGFSKHEN
jgi:myo-inositol-1(or 4)-monophosphatase